MFAQTSIGAIESRARRTQRANRQTTRGLIILVARLTAREHTRIFLICHYFVTPTNYEENESLLRGKKRMAAHDSYYRGRTEAFSTKIGLSIYPTIGAVPCATNCRFIIFREHLFGRALPCSHFRSVTGSTPSCFANAVWVSPSLLRTARSLSASVTEAGNGS